MCEKQYCESGGTPSQQAAQRVGNQQVDQSDEQASRQQWRAEVDFAVARETLALGALRQVFDRLQFRNPSRQVERTPGIRSPIKAGRVLGGCDRRGQFLARDWARGRRCMLQAAKPVEGFERRQRLLARHRYTLAHRHGPPQHLDE